MARRRYRSARYNYSNSNNSGCFGWFVIICIVIGIFQAYWQAIIGIAAVIFLIWAIVHAIRSGNNNNTFTQPSGQNTSPSNANFRTQANASPTSTTNTSSSSAPIIKQYSGTEPEVCHEINRQITDILNRRKELTSRLDKTNKSITRINNSLGKMTQERIEKRDALLEQKSILEGRINTAVYTFRGAKDASFTELGSALDLLKQANTRAHDNTPSPNLLFVPYTRIGDMNYVLFSADPICLSLGNDIFCIVPSYIVRFSKNGNYITTYTCKALSGRITNWSYTERITEYRWLYSRQDGGPDMRYRDNRQIPYQTNRTRTVPNVLHLTIASATLKYESDYTNRSKILSAIKAYSAVEPSTTYDPVYYVVQLLEACDESNPNLRRLQAIISGDDNYIEYDDEPVKNTVSSSQANHEIYQYVEEKPSKAKRFFKGFLKVCLAGTAIIVAFTIGSTFVNSNKNTTPENNATVMPAITPTPYDRNESAITPTPYTKPESITEQNASMVSFPTSTTFTTMASNTGKKPTMRTTSQPILTNSIPSATVDVSGLSRINSTDVIQIFDQLKFRMTQEEIDALLGTDYHTQYGVESGDFGKYTFYTLRYNENYYFCDYVGKLSLKLELEPKTKRRYLDEEIWNHEIDGQLTTNEVQTIVDYLNSKFGPFDSDVISDGTSAIETITFGKPYYRTFKWGNKELSCFFGNKKSSITYCARSEIALALQELIEFSAAASDKLNERITPVPVASPTPEPTPIIYEAAMLTDIHGLKYSKGSKGEAVRYIQQMLIDQSYLTAGQADGVYGTKTADAVKLFQENNGLNPTGETDPATQFKLAELESGFTTEESKTGEYAGSKRYGVYRFGNGVFIGIIKNDGSYQEGTLYYADNAVYAGPFKNNQRNGKGEAWFPNGDYYIGNWKDDQMNGKGVYHFGSVDSVEQYDGEWVNGQMSGKGTYTMADGTVIKAIWEDNQQVGWWK